MADTPNYTYLDYHKPTLEDGKYTVEVSQAVKITDETVAASDISPQEFTFHVEGPRFDLDPSLIHSSYPPKGGKGDYQAVLPNLVLERSTLPWERLPFDRQADDCSASWLYLLLIDETEEMKVEEKNNSPLASISSYFSFDMVGNPPKPDLSRSPSTINYLLVDAALAQGIIPANLTELEYLSYASLNDAREEMAVVLSNRLPRPGRNSTLYLISLENNFSDTQTFTGISDGKGNLVFPYLYKWKFHSVDDELFCIKESIKTNGNYPSWPDIMSLINEDLVYTTKESFTSTLNSIAGMTPKALQQITAASKLPGTTFHEVLSNLAGGFAPLCMDQNNGGIESSGSVKLDYHQVEKSANRQFPLYTKAWYRGPLIGTNLLPAFFSTPPSNAFNTLPENSSSLFLGIDNIDDASYASAFELGKLTALGDSDFCKEFYQWKNKAATTLRLKQLAKQGSYKNILHLPLTETQEAPNIPNFIQQKFDAWKRLIGIPYRYLISDDALLPNESIRFFKLDKIWVNAFIYGAFSIGKTVDADLSSYINGDPENQIPSLLLENDHYGFLINSIAVSAWPDFEVDSNHANKVSKQKLDVNIQLYLYDGRFTSLAFHLHTAKTHSGFLLENNKYQKLNGTVTASINPDNTIDIGPLCADLLTQFNLGNLSDPPSVPATQLTSMKVCDFANLIKEPTPEVIFNIH